MAELRELTTRFDLSFDAALARVEDRVGTLEQNAATPAVYTQAPAREEVPLLLRH